ncbi:MAG: hypothetical protein IJ410_03500 [Oscillospiraceae bacterium]|nr:hypothetical protein [Oscillospiraceae bacterium]
MKTIEDIRTEYRQRCEFLTASARISNASRGLQEKVKYNLATVEKVEAVIASLPEEEKEVVKRYFNREYRWAEKAAVDMGMSKTTVYRLLERAEERAVRLYNRL